MPSRIIQNVPVGTSLTAAPQSDVAAPQVQGAERPRQVVSPQATLKLSFGGVDFSLVPKTSRDGTVTFQAMGANEAVLSLKNFTGSLTVISTPNNAYHNNNNLVEDAGSPSPERPLTDGTNNSKPSPTQQQLTNMAAWNNNHGRKTGTPPGVAHHRGMSQAPTPTMRNSSIEQVVQANRSSPLPYHSPVKRSRKNPTATKQTGKTQKKAKTTNKASKPLSEQLPASPICLGQKSPASSSSSSPLTARPDCSQTMPSQPSTSSSSEKLQQPQDEESVATRNADDDADMAIMDSDDKDNHDSDNEDSDSDDDETIKSDKTKSATKSSTIVKAPSLPELVTPPPRWGHTMTMIDHNRLLMYGGQSFQAPPKGSKSTDVVPCTMSDGTS